MKWRSFLILFAVLIVAVLLVFARPQVYTKIGSSIGPGVNVIEGHGYCFIVVQKATVKHPDLFEGMTDQLFGQSSDKVLSIDTLVFDLSSGVVRESVIKNSTSSRIYAIDNHVYIDAYLRPKGLSYDQMILSDTKFPVVYYQLVDGELKPQTSSQNAVLQRIVESNREFDLTPYYGNPAEKRGWKLQETDSRHSSKSDDTIVFYFYLSTSSHHMLLEQIDETHKATQTTSGGQSQTLVLIDPSHPNFRQILCSAKTFDRYLNYRDLDRLEYNR